MSTKEERKVKNAAEKLLRDKFLQENLKVGTYLKNIWGCTMRRVNWAEVTALKINKGKIVAVYVRTPNYDDNSGGYDGYSTLIGPGNGPAQKTLIIRNGYLLEEGKSLKDSWSTYSFANVGDSEHVYCD